MNFTYQHIDKELLYQVVVTEGSKSYLTKHVKKDNKDRLFKPYKDLCGRIADIFNEYNPAYQYLGLLRSVHCSNWYIFSSFLNCIFPSLTDFANAEDEKSIDCFLEQLAFGALDCK